MFSFRYLKEVEVNGIKFSCYHAGHVLGAAMFMIEIAGVQVSFSSFSINRRKRFSVFIFKMKDFVHWRFFSSRRSTFNGRWSSKYSSGCSHYSETKKFRMEMNFRFAFAFFRKRRTASTFMNLVNNVKIVLLVLFTISSHVEVVVLFQFLLLVVLKNFFWFLVNFYSTKKKNEKKWKRVRLLFFSRRILGDASGITRISNLLCIIIGKEMYVCLSSVYRCNERTNSKTKCRFKSI